jgi:hypothetical protein
MPKRLAAIGVNSPAAGVPKSPKPLATAHCFPLFLSTMHDLGFVREHPEAIEKMPRDRGITLDLAPFRGLDGETVHNAFPDRGFKVPVS